MAEEKYKSVSVFALPDAYQQQAAEARRRRRMAEMLAQQAYQPGDIQNAPIPAAAPLVQGLQAYLTARAGRKADEAEESARETASREARQLFRALTEEGDTTTNAVQPAMTPMAKTVTAPQFEDGRITAPASIEMGAPPPMTAPETQLSRYNLTPGQRRAAALEGMLTSENPMLQKVAGAIYPTLAPKTPETKTMEFGGRLLNVTGGQATPVTMDGVAVTDPTKQKARTAAQDFGGFIRTYYSDGSYTDERKTLAPSRPTVGGGRDGAVGRGQQGPAFALKDGRIIQFTFDPATGQYMYQSDKGRVPVPADAKPTTASAASGLSEKQYITYRQEAFDHRKGLEKLNSYFQTVGGTNVGIARLADAISANAKNLFAKTLTPEELNLQVGAGKLQGLLGLFRTDIVGPGVLTEYDANRVIEALGGDMSALQNKERVRILLEQIYQDKKDRLEFLAEELGRSDSVRGGKPITASDLPSNLGSQNKVEEVDY